MTPDQEALCRLALDGMQTISLASSSGGAADFPSILHQHGLRTATIAFKQNTATGFTEAGVTAIDKLAKTFRRSSGQKSHRASNATIMKLISKEIMSSWAGKRSPSLARPDFDHLETVIDEWFRTLTQVREHLVPCSIFPCAASKFSVGPVTFRHYSDFPIESFNMSYSDFWPAQPPVWRQWLRDVWAAIVRKPVQRPRAGGFQFSTLIQFMNERAAPWVAFVKVTGRAPEESQRAADLSTDIALAAIQLVSPSKDMRAIARATDRAVPNWRADVSLKEGEGFSHGIKNQTPALARDPQVIKQHLQNVEPSLSSMGQRLTGFLDASSPVPDLDEAWCNAAYWYHAALAEELDTVAVAKLETAIEVLLRAESMSGSKRRLVEGFEIFYGLQRGDQIGSSPFTVEQFIEAITTARSRVLHGTWPTLQFDLPANKSSQAIGFGEVEGLARNLLLAFSGQLDLYIAAGNATDGVEAFFSWMKANQASHSATKATASSPPNKT